MLTATAIQPLNYDEFVESLNGAIGVTNGWDAVCSYSVDALNKVLKSLHQNGTLVSNLKLCTPPQRDIDPPHQLFSTEYDLNLDTPQLAFVAGSSGSAILTMPILGTSTYNIKDSKGNVLETDPISSGYSLVASVPLAAITGNNTVSAGGDVITLGNANSAKIVLHFKSSLTNFTIQPEPKNSDGSINTALTDKDMLDGVLQYFQYQVGELDYCLTEVASGSAGNPAGITIQPASFVMASDQNTLSLYIQTVNSGNPVGNPNPAFQPNGREMLPIPQNYQASLIFSRQFIENVYLVPLLKGGRGYSFTSQTNGIGMTFNSGSPTVTYDMSTGTRISGDFYIDTLVMDFSAPSLAYNISFNKSQGQIVWNFAQTLNWHGDESMPDGSGGWTKEGKKGSCNVSISLNKSISLANVDQQTFSIDCSVTTTPKSPPDPERNAGDYNVNSANSGDTDFWGPVSGNVSDLANIAKGGLPKELNLNFGSLNFFAVTNLLFPGRQVLNIDAAKGISIPGDLLLVANFVA